MKKSLLCAIALMLTGSSLLQAADHAKSSYYQVGSRSVTVEEVGPGPEAAPEPPALNTISNKVAAEMINTGLAAWKVIVDGKPSGTASSAYASALPPAVYLNWSAVSGWTGPKEYIYTYKITNLMNLDVIKVKYKISYHFGGTEAEGPVKGKYLTNFTVKAMEVKVLWGWGFDMDVKMSHPMNIGTPAKPVAQMAADISWSVSTPFTSDGGTWSYSVDATGKFRDLDAESRALTRSLPEITVPEMPEILWN